MQNKKVIMKWGCDWTAPYLYGGIRLKFIIKHEIRGRLRVHMGQGKLSCREADTLLYYLHRLPNVTGAKVYERTGMRLYVIPGSGR